MSGQLPPSALFNLLVEDLISPSLMANYASVAAWTVLFYDTLLYFPAEVRHIWMASWTFPKVLYIFARYAGLFLVGACVLSNTTHGMRLFGCQVYFMVLAGTAPVILNASVNLILLLRLHALYGHSRRILLALVGILAGELILEGYAVVRVARLEIDGFAPHLFGLNIGGCPTMLTVSTKALSLVAWVPCLIVSVIFFLLMAYKFWERVVAERWEFYALQKRGPKQHASPVWVAFFRDGTFYFMLTAVSTIVSTVLTITVQNGFRAVLGPFLLASFSFAGSHLILHLREVAYKQQTLRRNSLWDTSISFRLEGMD